MQGNADTVVAPLKIAAGTLPIDLNLHRALAGHKTYKEILQLLQ